MEGRYPNIYVSYNIAEAVGQRSKYIRDSGLDDEKCKAFILKALEKAGEIRKDDLMALHQGR